MAMDMNELSLGM